MELPKRKNMRLRRYDYSTNGAYFITICTENKRHLFGEMVGAVLCGRPNSPNVMLEKWLSEVPNKYKNVQMDKYVVMPNHIHAIVLLSGGHTGPPLPEIVGWFKTMTTNEYIKGVKDGVYEPFEKRIWQRGYYDHIIRSEDEYLRVWQYIDENPAKWTEDKYFSILDER